MVDKDCNQNFGYFQVNIGYISSSNVTISGRVGSTGDPVEEDGGIPRIRRREILDLAWLVWWTPWVWW